MCSDRMFSCVCSLPTMTKYLNITISDTHKYVYLCLYSHEFNYYYMSKYIDLLWYAQNWQKSSLMYSNSVNEIQRVSDLTRVSPFSVIAATVGPTSEVTRSPGDDRRTVSPQWHHCSDGHRPMSVCVSPWSLKRDRGSRYKGRTFVLWQYHCHTHCLVVDGGAVKPPPHNGPPVFSTSGGPCLESAY